MRNVILHVTSRGRDADASPIQFPPTAQQHLTPPQLHKMADFFNIKARQQLAAQASSSKAPTTKQEPNRLQPWVEK